MKYAVGIDIGGTNTRVALVSDKYKIEKRVQFLTDIQSPENTVNQITREIEKFQCRIEGIGMSCPGPLKLISGKILTPPNLPGWHQCMITKMLSAKTGVPVYLENDANLAALAEAVLGAGKGKKYVQFLTISTGVGAGFVVDGNIYHGSRGFAQEVANCIMWKEGPKQGDLMAGSIESISSGTAIVKRAKERDIRVDHAGQIYELAQKGNYDAKDIMEDVKEYLSNFIGMIYGILDPDIVILSGSVALKIPGFVEEIQERVCKKVYPALVDNVKIVKAKLDEDCGLIGAAYLAFQNK
ncbi:MAG: ROK family protein [Anaerostipes sp.]|nr:ROK family protein [Anaerostipes sp.]